MKSTKICTVTNVILNGKRNFCFLHQAGRYRHICACPVLRILNRADSYAARNTARVCRAFAKCEENNINRLKKGAHHMRAFVGERFRQRQRVRECVRRPEQIALQPLNTLAISLPL